MHLEDLDVPVVAEALRDLLDQAEQQVDAEAGIGRPDHRHVAGRVADRLLLLAGEAGRADHDWPPKFGGERRMAAGRRRRGELDRDIAVAQQPVRAVAGDDAKPADPGELAEVLADRAAARPGDAAGQRAALGRDDVGDQHAAHPAAAPDNPDSGLGHACLPR